MKVFILLAILISQFSFASTWEFRTAKSLDTLDLQTWNKFPNNGNPIAREYDGYIEYRSTFFAAESSQEIGLYLGLIGDADKAFVNGVQVGQSGNFPPNYSYNMDTERTYFLPNGLVKKGPNTIRLLAYSKFLVNKGFNPKNFKVAPVTELDKTKYVDELQNNLSKIIIPILCLVLTVVSFPLLAPKHLWNSQFMIFLIGLSSFVLGICRGRSAYHFFDMLDVYKTTLVSSILTIWLVTVFMTRSCKNWLRFIPSMISAGLITTVLLSTTLIETASWGKIWFHISPIFLSAALYGSLKVSGLRSLRSFGLIVLIATNLNDNLNDLRIISTFSILQIGLGIFIASMIIDQLLGLKRSWEKYFMKEAQLEIDAATGRQAIQIAHDLRSPIESIKVGLSNMKSSKKYDDLSVDLGLKRMQEICNSLLQKKHLNNHTHSFLDIKIAVNEIICELHSTVAETSQISHSCSETVSVTESSFNFDLSMLKRTVCNLITNSIEASNGIGRVWVTTNIDGNFLKVSVQDEGAGISGNSEEIFERGFTTKSNGNGLGLSSAKQFIENLNGIITINKLEKGTIVTLMIPSSTISEEKTVRKSKEIVLIDDDPLVRFNWKRQGQNHSIQVHAFETFEAFLNDYHLFVFDTPIFIDSNLGRQKGELLSEDLLKLGFKSIYLTTGLPEKINYY